MIILFPNSQARLINKTYNYNTHSCNNKWRRMAPLVLLNEVVKGRGGKIWSYMYNNLT